MWTATCKAVLRTRAPPVHAAPCALLLVTARAWDGLVLLAAGGMALVAGCLLPLRRTANGAHLLADGATPVSLPPVAGLPPLVRAVAATPEVF